MATKDEVVGGLQMLAREARRIGERFSEDAWLRPGDEGGWNCREVLAHVSGVGALVPVFAPSTIRAGAGDGGAQPAMDVDAINAQLVGQRKDKSLTELLDELEKNYAATVEWARQQPDSFYEQRATLGGYRNFGLGDLLMQAVVMHGLSHLYHVAASEFIANQGGAAAPATDRAASP